MKKCFFLSGLFFGILFFSFSGSYAQWVQTHGPYGAHIRALACKGDTIVAGTYYNGVWRSVNNGSSWIAVNNGLPVDDDPYVYSLAINGNNIFASFYDGVYLSTNDGSNWNWVGNGLPSYTYVNAFAFNGNNIFAGSHDGVFLSTDNGKSWNEVNNGLKNVAIYSLAIKGNNIFAGGNDGVYFSTNNASSWNQVKYLGNSVEDIKIYENNIFAICSTGKIYLSTNNGSSWENINNGIPSTGTGDALTINGGNIFAATSAGIFLSTNDGANWKEADNGLPTAASGINSLSNNGNKIFAGTSRGVWCSSDNGVNWKAANNGFTIPKVFSIAGSGNNIVASTDYGIYYSSDNGIVWTQSNKVYGFLRLGFGRLIVSGNNIYGNVSGIIIISTDNGSNWDAVKGWKGSSLLAISGNSIYTDGINVSTNNGLTWNLINNGLPNKSVYSFAFSGTNILAGLYDGGGVYLSTNMGASWNKVLANPGVTSLAANENNVFAGTVNGIYISSDNGLNWNLVADIDFVEAFVFSGKNIFAANSGGVHLSKDDGITWNKVNEGFPIRSISGIKFPPSLSVNTLNIAGNTIYAGAADGSGIWRRPLSELITGINDTPINLPNHFALGQNYPNPFISSTKINYSVLKPSFISIKVYDLLGNEIQSLVNEEKNMGEYDVEFYAKDLPRGVYLYKMQAEDFVDTKQFILMK
jgi:hypothetical protein